MMGKEGEFRKNVSKGVAVVGFWAPWCHTCHVVMPILGEVSSAMREEARFFKVNVVENPSVASKYGVMSLPNILIFKENKVADQIIGSASKKTIKKKKKKTL